MKTNVFQGFGIFLFILCCGLLVGNSILKKSRNYEPLDAQLDRENLSFLRSLQPDRIGINTIVALFHPSCDFCQAEAKMVEEQIEQLENIDLIWVSYDDKESIAQFSKTYGLDSFENVHFAYMDIEVMLERYGNVKFPTFLAYDQNGVLLQKFVGVTKPEKYFRRSKQIKCSLKSNFQISSMLTSYSTIRLNKFLYLRARISLCRAK
jgi:thiol-disulfide isomerase/thioredoxin